MIDDFTEMVTADINGLFKDDLKIFFRKTIKDGCEEE
jgi:hypothetical protein